jgi:subtilisin family serine protease
VTGGSNGDPVATTTRRRSLAAFGVALLCLALLPVQPAAGSSGSHGSSAALDQRLLVVTAPEAAGRVGALTAAAGASWQQVSATVLVAEASSPSAADALAARLRDDRDVLHVERDGLVEGVRTIGSVATPAQAQPGADHPLSDDPLLTHQWALRNTGQVVDGRTATAGVDVRAAEAWRWTRGLPDVVVAVVDSGIDGSHPDLDGQLWVNPLAGTTREGCGGALFRGDVHGWDFVEGKPAGADPDGHGTAVASVIAARADDAYGMAGLAPDVRVMSLRTFSSTPSGGLSSRLTDIACAISYAVANGADVINASWVTYRDSFAMQTVISETDVPIVAAAGNDGYDPTRSPGDPLALPAGYGYPHVVAVTSIDPRGAVPRFANTDRQRVHLAAPGTSIIAAHSEGGHRRESGTSFSAPFVTAALALAISQAPYASTRDLVDTLERTTRVLPSLERATSTGGMLDAGALVAEVQRPLCRPDRVGPPGFSDVPPSSAHAAAIACLVQFDIASGRRDGTFEPGALVTRAQLASFLARVVDAAGRLPADAPDAFLDDDGSVHEAAIDALAALGVVQGGSDGRFKPDDPVKRDQLSSMLVRTYEVLTDQAVTPSRRWFTDTSDSVHRHTIDAARDLGTVRGVERGRFGPSEPARRDHVASFVARLIDALARGGVPIEG